MYMFGKLKDINHSRERITAPYPFSWFVAIITSHGIYTRSMRRVQLLMVCCMGGVILMITTFLLNITVDINAVLFSLTHAVLILTLFVKFKINMYYALLHKFYVCSN